MEEPEKTCSPPPEGRLLAVVHGFMTLGWRERERSRKTVIVSGQGIGMTVLSFAWRKGSRSPQQEGLPTSPTSRDALSSAAIQLLPDAVLIVQREIATAPLRVAASNVAAQEMLQIRPGDENLVSVLRHPEILSAVEDSLASGESHSVSCDTGG